MHKHECVHAHGPKPSSMDRHATALLSAAIKPCLPIIHLSLLREDVGTRLQGRVLYVNSNFSPSRVGLLTIPEVRLRLDAAAAAHAQGHAQVAQMARTLGVGITEAKQLRSCTGRGCTCSCVRTRLRASRLARQMRVRTRRSRSFCRQSHARCGAWSGLTKVC